MPYRQLGPTIPGAPNPPRISTIGLGCMGMTDFYGTPDDEESIATFHRAVDLGVNFFDTADVYGPFTNEELIARAIKTLPAHVGSRADLVIATKFGLVRGADKKWLGTRGDRAYIRECCEASLKRLGVDVIDLYYAHRLAADVPVEETIGAMAELIHEGKVRTLGLSEVSAATLRRACAVHPIAALQSEYSLWTRDPEGEILDACRELGITFVPYSPLGRGFLTGALSDTEDLPENDARRAHPRFQGENFQRNLRIAAMVRELAAANGCTPAQLALAWVLAQNETEEADRATPGFGVVPVPGAKRRTHLQENVGAVDVHLSRGDIATIDGLFPQGVALGDRYPANRMTELNR